MNGGPQSVLLTAEQSGMRDRGAESLLDTFYKFTEQTVGI